MVNSRSQKVLNQTSIDYNRSLRSISRSFSGFTNGASDSTLRPVRDVFRCCFGTPGMAPTYTASGRRRIPQRRSTGQMRPGERQGNQGRRPTVKTVGQPRQRGLAVVSVNGFAGYCPDGQNHARAPLHAAGYIRPGEAHALHWPRSPIATAALPAPSRAEGQSAARPCQAPCIRPIAEHRNPRRTHPTGVPQLSPAITRVSPTPAVQLDRKAPTCTNGPDLDHLDARRRFLQPVPRRPEGSPQDEDGGAVGTVDPVLQGLLAHPTTLTDAVTRS